MTSNLINPFLQAAATFAAATVALGPTVYWKMNEGAGATTAIDYSGGGHDGTHIGGVTPDQAALLANGDKSYSFNGSSGYINLADGAYLDHQTAISGFCWMKTNSTSNRALLDRDGGISNRGWQFRHNFGTLSFVKIGGSGGTITVQIAASVNDNNVHMVGFTYDGANIRLYKDGALIQTGAAAGNLPANVDSDLRFGVNASPGLTSFYSGLAGHAAYFAGRVLTDAEFANLYTLGTTP